MGPDAALLRALRFAADKHRDHRRKDAEASPYINHPIAVAELLSAVGGVRDLEVLQAAILHDTLEDTDTSAEELERHFGCGVRGLVEELSDDKRLPKPERKRRQVERAPRASRGAKLIKLADKTCNLRDVAHAPPRAWSAERRSEYLAWSRAVVAGCRGANAALDRAFDAACAELESRLAESRA